MTVLGVTAMLVRLRNQHLWDQHNLDLYRRLVDGRQAERDRAARREADLEARICDLHATVVDMLAVFTDEKWPNAPGARIRSGWVDHRRVREWRAQVVEPEPDTVSAADTEEVS